MEECSSTLATTYSSGTPGQDASIVTVDQVLDNDDGDDGGDGGDGDGDGDGEEYLIVRTLNCGLQNCAQVPTQAPRHQVSDHFLDFNQMTHGNK